MVAGGAIPVGFMDATWFNEPLTTGSGPIEDVCGTSRISDLRNVAILQRNMRHSRPDWTRQYKKTGARFKHRWDHLFRTPERHSMRLDGGRRGNGSGEIDVEAFASFCNSIIHVPNNELVVGARKSCAF
jgi:hypothetical protein